MKKSYYLKYGSDKTKEELKELLEKNGTSYVQSMIVPTLEFILITLVSMQIN
ncbi:hypothetical protein [Serratia fonticola]|uniref:hypothetical protein n=1 Tax=Serratia fonticola TaxID=47917 RepID=UPI001ED905A3|nr:hypothetical protein [Serratia fonticola]CAI1950765.1 Uncharacterised protein [Serratia fonticola]